MRLSCAIEALILPQLVRYGKRIPDDKTWNVAPADTPHKIRFQPALMSLDSTKLVVDSVRAGDGRHRGGIFRVAAEVSPEKR